MSCIDCGEQKPVMLTQETRVSRATREWQICVSCFLRSEQLRGTHANRKAKGLA